MAISSRAGLAVGLLGVAALVGAAFGQQGDSAVRKASGNGAGAAAASPATAAPSAAAGKPAVVATIDLEQIFRNYEKTKFQQDQLQTEMLARRGQLQSLATEAQELAKQLQALQAGSKDYKEREAKFTELRARIEAGKESMQRDGQMKMVEIMANFYKEASDMTSRYARYKGITCVLRISNEPADSRDPESVGAAMARQVMYSDPSLDITKHILHNLNKEYTEAGGPVVKTPAAGATGANAPAGAIPGTTDEAATPASATAPQRPAAAGAPRTGAGAAPAAGRAPAPTRGQN